MLDRLRPERPQVVDCVFAVVLGILGVIGFRTTFSGGEELLVGAPAVFAGVGTGYVVTRLRLPLLPGVAAATVVFFVLAGPVALRHHAIGGVLPSPAAFEGLADGLVNGWIELLTTLPPAGEAGDLLTVPYACGFAGGALAVVLALRYPHLPVCVIPPALLLAVSVLFGVRRPASLVLQGAVFAGATIVWVSLRHRRVREVVSARPSRSRLALAGGLVTASCLGGLVVGPMLPGADVDERYVLREDVEPPFDPLSETSPLAGYRLYTDEERLRDEEVLRVRGLPRGGAIRIGVMDDYDGLVWRSTGRASVLAGEYLRVGARIPADGLGDSREVHVEVVEPHGVWVPLGGDVTSVDFTGDRSDELDDALRVSIESDAGAVPAGLEGGDTYRFTAEFGRPIRSLAADDVLIDPRFPSSEPDPNLDSDLQTLVDDLVAEVGGSAATPIGQLQAVADHFVEVGGYTDGGVGANPVSPPGHSVSRMLQFFGNAEPFGNGEQFAAALGIVARARGIPARVAMGFRNHGESDDVTFTGADIEAWIEVPVAGVGWVMVSGTPPEDRPPEPIVEQRNVTANPEPQPPPPTTIPPPTTVPLELESEEDDEEEDDRESGDDSGLPPIITAAGGVGVVALLLAGPGAVVAAMKSGRRNRRRRHGSPSERLAGSFTELVDWARDLGTAVPPQATRLEVSTVVGTPGAKALARRADAAVFGPGQPSDADVEAAWSDFESARRDLVADVGRGARLRAAVSPTSLRRLR